MFRWPPSADFESLNILSSDVWHLHCLEISDNLSLPSYYSRFSGGMPICKLTNHCREFFCSRINNARLVELEQFGCSIPASGVRVYQHHLWVLLAKNQGAIESLRL